MSLINDALKKAQRQRDEGTPAPTEGTTPASAPEPLQRVARREKPAGFRSQLILIGGGALAAVLLLGIGGMFLFRSTENTPAAIPAKPTPVAVAPTPVVPPPVVVAQPAVAPATPALVVQAPPSTPAPISTPVPVSTPVSSPQLTLATPPAVAPPTTTAPSGQFTLPPAPVAEVAPTAVSTPVAAPPVTSERPKASTRMIGVIEHFRVGGIRMAGPDSKVLMNDKVYRLNDIVDFELNIRLTNIEAKALTFEDSHGAIHVRTF